MTGGIRLDFVDEYTPVPDDAYWFRGFLIRTNGAIMCVDDYVDPGLRTRFTSDGKTRVDSAANNRITNETQTSHSLGGLKFTPEGYLWVDSNPMGAVLLPETRATSGGLTRLLSDGRIRILGVEDVRERAGWPAGRVVLPGGLAVSSTGALYIQKSAPENYIFQGGTPLSILGALQYIEIGDVRLTSDGKYRLTSTGAQRVTIGDLYTYRKISTGPIRYTSEGAMRSIRGDVLIPDIRVDSAGNTRVDSSGNTRVTRGD